MNLNVIIRNATMSDPWSMYTNGQIIGTVQRMEYVKICNWASLIYVYVSSMNCD